MNRFFVHHRSPHHAVNSGYGKLIDYIDGQVIYGQTKFPYRLAKLLSKMHSQSAGIYNSSSVLKTIELYQVLKRTKGQTAIVHFLNGERDVRYLGLFKKRFPNAKFCATFHKPPDILKRTITKLGELKKLDGAICVGENQVGFVKEWLQLGMVEYIPHGIDTEFFQPPTEKPDNDGRILFVGQHLRDFSSFNKVIQLLLDQDSSLYVDVVVHPAYRNQFVQNQRISIHSGVSDETLKQLYLNATLLFLPLLNATACNSLLEAMSCGLPIVTTDVGGVRAYLKNTGNSLCPAGAIDALIESVNNLLGDREQRCLLAEESRQRSLSYDWKEIANSVEDFYVKLMRGVS